MSLKLFKLGFFAAVCAFMTADISAQAPKTDYPLRDAVEFTVRGGMPNFLDKLKSGKPVKIAYLGGSITAQDGWRVQSLAYFKKMYPEAKAEQIHAAIGGTGSDLGVFRLEHDALDMKPDLLFVEFAVNDAGASPENITRSMEGIVRKTWKALPDTDICFVYTITADNTKGLQEGKMKRSESVMEAVADHYNIPSIHMGIKIAALEKEGKLIMKVPDAKIERVSGDELNSFNIPKNADGKIIFSKDGVHPMPETGHVLYMEAIAKAMDEIKKITAKASHKLPAPLAADNLENAKMISLDKAAFSASGVTKLSADNGIGKQFANRMPGVWKLEPGATLSFKFKGTKASIYDILGPDCGKLEITIDGNARTTQRIDGYCTYHRLAILPVGDKLENKEHEVTIKVLPEELDKSKILFKHNLGDMEKNPAKYKGSNWYAGAIFIVGDML